MRGNAGGAAIGQPVLQLRWLANIKALERSEQTELAQFFEEDAAARRALDEELLGKARQIEEAFEGADPSSSSGLQERLPPGFSLVAHRLEVLVPVHGDDSESSESSSGSSDSSSPVITSMRWVGHPAFLTSERPRLPHE